eukprot:NODE_4843_length_635_cov_254.108621.p2 GENE.NODE_4843_length_635_cov_254.108621~~NODE_4843_length_635_cov_254.108621.p2  ORF type:complete len:153 (+),score=53.43 NODE_4843_length_635_cov_254.108621:3-461(+)
MGDRQRSEASLHMQEEERRAHERAEAASRREAEEAARAEEIRKALYERRMQVAAQLEPEGPEAKARLSMRLPTGQRLERRFRPEAALRDVYAWADCAGLLPENRERGVEIPARFALKTSFPSRELTQMEQTIAELQLAGSNIMLTALDEDDD